MNTRRLIKTATIIAISVVLITTASMASSAYSYHSNSHEPTKYASGHHQEVVISNDFCGPIANDSRVSAGLNTYLGQLNSNITTYEDTTVYAPSDGIVTQAENGSTFYGTFAVVDYPGGITTLYAHNKEIKVKVGDKVKQGQIIAIKANSDNQTDYIQDAKTEDKLAFSWPCTGGYVGTGLEAYPGHTGVDIVGTGGVGSPINASADGKVIKAIKTFEGYGNHVIIAHEDGYETVYAHCNELYVKVGDKVVNGQIIATVGSTGNSPGPQLHFEIRQNGQILNPSDYILDKQSFAWPCNGGYVGTALEGYPGHTGVDIVGTGGVGSPIFASADGTVTQAKRGYTGYGNYIIIAHTDGYETLYAQCNDLYVKAGDTVKKGQTIGEVGSTGNSSGPHLHFEVRKDGNVQNPSDYIAP